MIPVRTLFGNANNNNDENTNNTDNTRHNNEEDEELGIVYINDEENQPPIINEDFDEEIHYMVDEDDEQQPIQITSTIRRNQKNTQLIESVPSIIEHDDLVSDYFRFRLGSLALFQKKTTQLGFPLRLILNAQENPSRVELTSENLPSYLLQEYMFNEEDHITVNNEMEEYVNLIMAKEEKEKLTLLSPMIHLIKDITRMKFAWRSATSLEYKHAKVEKNQKRENENTVSNQATHTHEYLENLPSVFQIEKLGGSIPISYYYNQRIVIQLHPYLCLQVKPSELRQSKHYNISHSKTSKYKGYYFYFEITILDSNFTSKYGDEAVTEVGVGLSEFRYEDGMTGWYNNSIGYHTDCGRIYLNQPENTEKNYAGRAKIGDTIGVSWSLDTGDIIFTRNGIVCRTAVGVSCWSKDFWSKEFKSFCPTISSDYEQQVFYVNMGLNRAIYPFRYFMFNTYEEQEIMFSYIDKEGHPFADINIITRE